jgi:hypothetical protein
MPDIDPQDVTVSDDRYMVTGVKRGRVIHVTETGEYIYHPHRPVVEPVPPGTRCATCGGLVREEAR